MNDTPSPESEPQRFALLGHELRTPLNAIIGYAEAMTIEAFGPLPAPYGEHAATIHRAALHLLTLLDDLTDQSQAEAGVWAGARSVFDAADLALEVTSLLKSRAEGGEITLGLTTEAGVGHVRGDRRALRQILLNLLDNALKFTARGGDIVVTLSREANGLHIAVTDSGGRAGEKGAGVGLRLVRALCGAHGGAMDLTPMAGGGTKVVVRMPILTEP